MKTSKLILAAASAILLSFSGISASAATFDKTRLTHQDAKMVWGGGKQAVSSYSGKIVPVVIDQMAKVRLAGYKWGGPSAGTYMNAALVTLNPTHTALGQADILKTLNGTPIPGGTGLNYAFRVVQPDIGDECLYMVTRSPHYKTLGHVLENAWDISIATGGPQSGSFGTLTRILMKKLPALKDAAVKSVGGSKKIVAAVVSGSANFGFFVMRPDAGNPVFKTINDKKLTLVPVADFALEEVYELKSLKVAAGSWGGLGESKYHTTSCTKVQLITGDPKRLTEGQSRHKRRLDATIKRLSSIDGDEFKKTVAEQFGSWSDVLDSVKAVASDKAKELMEASKAAAKKVARKVTE